MAEYFTTERTARKSYRCSKCTQRIKPGAQYREHRLPPNGEMGNTGWWLLRNHIICPPYPSLLTPTRPPEDRPVMTVHLPEFEVTP